MAGVATEADKELVPIDAKIVRRLRELETVLDVEHGSTLGAVLEVAEGLWDGNVLSLASFISDTWNLGINMQRIPHKVRELHARWMEEEAAVKAAEDGRKSPEQPEASGPVSVPVDPDLYRAVAAGIEKGIIKAESPDALIAELIMREHARLFPVKALDLDAVRWDGNGGPLIPAEARTFTLTLSEETAWMLLRAEETYGEPLTVENIINAILDSEMQSWTDQPETREWAIVKVLKSHAAGEVAPASTKSAYSAKATNGTNGSKARCAPVTGGAK